MTVSRIRIDIEGIVQGVGFRPFLFRLANRHGLTGWVMNTTYGVTVEVQGGRQDLAAFQSAIPEQSPPLAAMSSFRVAERAPVSESGFMIRPSGAVGGDVQVAPDADVCPDCLAELFDKSNRRHRYPFINCTNCGPRFTIIKSVPYDRAATTMSEFAMCTECRAEYDDPGDRRFHAQPNACPVCGPSLTLVDGNGNEMADAPLDAAISLLRQGKIVAIKGVGGYHLAVDACNPAAVQELRKRKKRDEKPFALMSPDLASIAGYAAFDDMERRLLEGPERPIVLLRKRQQNDIAPLVAPGNGYFGVLLPYAPLHHLLLKDNFTALVMTSGNMTDEPICYRDDDVLQRLGDLADAFLIHNRQIHTRTDDSVVRVFDGKPIFLRRSRGYAPRPLRIPAIGKTVLGVGAELKGVVCLANAERAFFSQHIGDLNNPDTLSAMGQTVSHLERLLKLEPDAIAHDLHPDYLSSGYAKERRGPAKVAVQHHHAHMASCMAENGLEGEVIGVILDGSGYGADGTIWGGEFLVGGYTGFVRKGHFLAVPLLGGDAAVREPYRMAISYLYAAFGEACFDIPLAPVAAVAGRDKKLLLKMLERRINSPDTSSCGRLFDAVAAILGVRQTVSYEGQAAIELEALAERGLCGAPYPFDLDVSQGTWLSDFRPTIRSIVADVASGRPGADIARAFHCTVAAAAAATCSRIGEATGIRRVALSGGVFQNKLLSEDVHTLLTREDFEVFTQRLAPPNDGGIALGQAMIAGRRMEVGATGIPAPKPV